jgi:acyl transferase domain-containing protein
MREIADDFRQVVAGISFHEPQIALVSNISGQIADPAELSTPEYWVRHIGQAVHFADGVQAIEARGRHIFLEVGPSSTLLTLGKLSVDSGQHLWFASHHQRDADIGLRSVAGLYAAGLPFAWRSFHRGRPQQTIDLPHHVFDHRRYWLPTDGSRHSASAVPDIGSLRHPLLGDEIQPESAGADQERVFRSRIRPDSPGWLAEHVVMGQIIFPGAGYVEVLLALLDEVDGSTARTLRDIRIHEPLLMPPGQTVELCTRIRRVGDAAVDIDISTRTHTPDGVIERVHVTAAVAGSAEEPRDADRLRHIVAELTALAGPTNVDVDPAAIEDRYAEFAELGLHYGPQFQRIQWLERHGDSTVRAQLRGRRTSAMEQLPPEILDNAMQAVTALIADGQTYLPVRFGRLRLLSKPKSATLRAVLRLAGGSNDDEMSVDLLLLDGDRPVAIVSDLGLKKVKRATGTSARNGSAP